MYTNNRCFSKRFEMNKNKREELRMKTGRSKRCLLCQNHRCIIGSCQCECHKDYSGRLVLRTPRRIHTKRVTKLKKTRIKTSSHDVD